MDVHGSAIKTYPSKNKRISRSYRGSSIIDHQKVFDDDDDVFDKLINDEKQKRTFIDKNSVTDINSVVKYPASHRLNRLDQFSVLQSVQNVHVPCTERTIKKKMKSVKLRHEKVGKENIARHHSRLFLSDEDSDGDIYEFNHDANGSVKKRIQRSRAQRYSKTGGQLMKAKVKLLKAYRKNHCKELLALRKKAFQAISTPHKDADIVNWKCEISRIGSTNFVHRQTEKVQAEYCSFSPFNAQSKKGSILLTEKSNDIFFSQSFKNHNIIRKKLSFPNTRNVVEPNSTPNLTDLSLNVANEKSCSESEISNNKTWFQSDDRKYDNPEINEFNPSKVSTPENKKTDEEIECHFVNENVFNMSTSVDNSLNRSDKLDSNDISYSSCSLDKISNKKLQLAIDARSHKEDELDDDRTNETESDGELITESNQSQYNYIYQKTKRNSCNLYNKNFSTLRSNEDVSKDCSQLRTLSKSNLLDKDLVNDSLVSNIETKEQYDCAVSVASSLRNLTLKSKITLNESTESLKSEMSSLRVSENDVSNSRNDIDVLYISENNYRERNSTFEGSLEDDIGRESLEVNLNSPPRVSSVCYGFTDESVDRALSEKQELLNAIITSSPDSVFTGSDSLSDGKNKYQTAINFEESSFKLPSYKRYSRQSILLQPFEAWNGVSCDDEVDLTISDDLLMVTVLSKDGNQENDSKTNEEKINTPPRGEVIRLENISPIEKLGNPMVSSIETRRIRYFSTMQTSSRNSVSIFEPVLEEKPEDAEQEYSTQFESTRSSNVIASSYNKNFTSRRKRPTCFLPTVVEAESDEDGGSMCNAKANSNSDISQFQMPSFHGTTFSQPIHLTKGKQWRRSFINLKNMYDCKFDVRTLNDGNKGRRWKENVTILLKNNQSDSAFITQELQECDTPKTGSDETAVAGFEEGDIISARYGRAEKARFSISVSILDNSSHDSGQSSQFQAGAHSSGTSFVDGIRESVGIQAGDCSRLLGIPNLDRSLPESAREIVLLYCQQNESLPFETCFPDSVLRNCKKIGEGVYGEVFMVKHRSRCSVLKIIPIEGAQLVNGERQKKFDEIISELVTAVQLSNLKKRTDFYTECFAEVQNCRCVYGRYPERLISLWKEYDLLKGSENDSPKMFKDDQMYIILELKHGGEDVESFLFSSAQQTLSVFNQVTLALAVAEQAFSFEHRDLHWGNILVTRTKNKTTNFIMGDNRRTEKLHGVKVTIIDYTLSRISLSNRVLYNDLERDPDLFVARGDLQFEVYRLMRSTVKNVWDRFVPKTNVFWLFYLLDKFIKEVHYRRPSTRTHKQSLAKIKQLYENILNFDSSYQVIENFCIV